MASIKRIQHEPAYVLHGYDWSESSRIIELFTRNYGRVAVVAKGVKRYSSNFRAVLLPLQLLRVGYGGNSEISTLKSAEWQGGHVMPSGEILLAGYYVNELIMRLLARDDPHLELFDIYRTTITTLAQHANQREYLQASLRSFELLLLREVGLLPDLSQHTNTQNDTQIQYVLHPENGLCVLDDENNTKARGLESAQLQSLYSAMQQKDAFAGLLNIFLQQRELAFTLKTQLRSLLVYHCGISALHTRQLMIKLHNL